MKTLHIALALGLFSLVVACGDDGETTTSSGSGGAASGSGGEDAGSGGDTSSPSSSNASGNSQGSNSASTASTASGEGGNGGDGGNGDGGEGGAPANLCGGGAGGAGEACRVAAPADRDRYVVVGHSFDTPDTDWEVLRLTQAGDLEITGNHFQMGVAEDVRIAFTPDGEIGVAAQDGSVGVFRIDEEGEVTVLDANVAPDIYAVSMAMSADGSFVLVGDGNTTENGGGLYRIDLDCESGEPTYVGLVADVNNAWGVLDLGGGRWAVGSQGGALGVENDSDVTDLCQGDPWTLVSGADPFPYEGRQIGAFAASRDGKYILAGDYSSFGDQPTNLALVQVASDGLVTVEGSNLLLDTPYDVAISPEGDVALVASYFGDALYVVDVDPSSETPLTFREELQYQGAGAALSGKMATIDRGSLDGYVLASEVYGIRVVSFDGGGEVTDHGLLMLGEDEESVRIPVGIGVQP